MSADVVVVGSLNLDVVVPVERHPAPGETVLGGDHVQLPGGKGANQAVALARLGRSVAMVGRVGADDPGRRLRAALEAEGVDARHVLDDPGAPSGLAMISVTDDGENTIVVSPGANGRVGHRRRRRRGRAARARPSSPSSSSRSPPPRSARRPRPPGACWSSTPPPRVPWTPSCWPASTCSCPTAPSWRCSRAPPSRTAPRRPRSSRPGLQGPRAVVVTLGADGAVVSHERGAEHIPAPAVDAVDATGAGDAFCGALSDALAGGAELVEAARWAVRAASISVTRPGAQDGMPTRAELEAR